MQPPAAGQTGVKFAIKLLDHDFVRTRTSLPVREVKARWRRYLPAKGTEMGMLKGCQGDPQLERDVDLPRFWRWILRRNGVHCVESGWATHVENEIFAQPQEHPRSLSPRQGNGQLGTLNDREKAATRSTAPPTRPRSQSPSRETPGRQERKLITRPSQTLDSVVA